MRLTSFTDFGLRMLMRLASAPERAFSSAELADEFNLSRNHLAKIIQHLAHAGLLETRRGGAGGVKLAKAPDDISLGSLIALLEQNQSLVACFAGDREACSLDGRCRLKGKLRAAEAAFIATLERSTLAEIALPPLPPVSEQQAA